MLNLSLLLGPQEKCSMITKYIKYNINSTLDEMKVDNKLTVLDESLSAALIFDLSNFLLII